MNKFTEEKIQEAVAHFMDTAKNVFRISGGHDPMVVYFAEATGVHMASLAPMMRDAETLIRSGDIEGGYAVKNSMGKAMKELAVKHGAFGAISIFEAWTKKVAKNDIQTLGGDEPGMGTVIAENPRFAPDRKEVLMVAWEFRMEDGSKSQGSLSVEIMREKHGIVFGPTEKLAGLPAGRMTGLIE